MRKPKRMNIKRSHFRSDKDFADALSRVCGGNVLSNGNHRQRRAYERALNRHAEKVAADFRNKLQPEKNSLLDIERILLQNEYIRENSIANLLINNWDLSRQVIKKGKYNNMVDGLVFSMLLRNSAVKIDKGQT